MWAYRMLGNYAPPRSDKNDGNYHHVFLLLMHTHIRYVCVCVCVCEPSCYLKLTVNLNMHITAFMQTTY